MIDRLFSCLVLFLAIAAAPVLPAHAGETCPFISAQDVAIPELGREAFGEHSCTRGNGNAVNIFVWKNGRQASVLFVPVKPHPESGSVERLKAVAGRVYGKL
jgi:hypothetical protein